MLKQGHRSINSTAKYRSANTSLSIFILSSCIFIATQLFACHAAFAQQHKNRRDHSPQNSVAKQDIGPAAAANMARSMYGGKVLKVSKSGDKYRVKLLLPNGTVKSIAINAHRR